MLKTFVSSADKYVRLERNESWEVCYGYDENKMKPQKDADGCGINRRSAPKCGMGEGVNERWGILKNYDPNDIENLYARRSYRYAWRNTSVANFMYRPGAYSTVGNAVYTLQSMFAVLAGVIALVSSLKLTNTRKLLLVVMLITLTTSTYSLYSSANYLTIQAFEIISVTVRDCQTQRTTKPVRFLNAVSSQI